MNRRSKLIVDGDNKKLTRRDDANEVHSTTPRPAKGQSPGSDPRGPRLNREKAYAMSNSSSIGGLILDSLELSRIPGPRLLCF